MLLGQTLSNSCTELAETRKRTAWHVVSEHINCEERLGCNGHGAITSLRSGRQISGGDSEEVPPDPIPNSEVKLFSADGTARETWWESRTSPGFIFPRAHGNMGPFFL